MDQHSMCPAGWQRISRIWQAQEVGDVGTVTMEVDTESSGTLDLDNLSGSDSSLPTF